MADLPSNRMKARLLAFIIAKRYLHAGANDALLPWIFYKTGWRRYTHHRVGDIEPLLLALETDGDILLTRDQWGKITAVDLTAHYEISHAEFEAELFTTPVELWTYITILQGKLAQLQEHPKETATALEMAIEAECQRDEALLRVSVLEAEIANRTDTSELERQLAELRPELERALAENAVLASKVAFLDGRVLEVKATAAAAKRTSDQKLTDWGSLNARDTRELEAARNVIDAQFDTIRTLTSLCRKSGVGTDQLKDLHRPPANTI